MNDLKCDMCWMWDDGHGTAKSFTRATGGPDGQNAGRLVAVCDICKNRSIRIADHQRRPHPIFIPLGPNMAERMVQDVMEDRL